MSGTTIIWRDGFTPAHLVANAEAYLRRVEAATLAAAREIAAVLETTAQASAPWQDQTGAARAGLHAGVELAGALVTIYLSHGPDVDYGIYLETAHAERYAVIWPTIRGELDGVWRRIAERLR